MIKQRWLKVGFKNSLELRIGNPDKPLVWMEFQTLQLFLQLAKFDHKRRMHKDEMAELNESRSSYFDKWTTRVLSQTAPKNSSPKVSDFFSGALISNSRFFEVTELTFSKSKFLVCFTFIGFKFQDGVLPMSFSFGFFPQKNVKEFLSVFADFSA